MKKLMIATICSLLFACNPATNKTEQTEDTSFPKKISENNDPGEDFDKFFETFSSDSVFQISRYIFPLKYSYWGEDDNYNLIKKYESIKRSNWRFDDFQDQSNRRYDAYEILKLTKEDTVIICKAGIDNGICLEYIFTQVDGEWHCDFLRDRSN